MPREALAVTIGVDVQGDRLEATVTGWAKDNTCYVLGHQVLWGDTGAADADVWHELDSLLRQRFRIQAEAPWGDSAAIDGGDGGMMDTVTAFCAPRFGKRVFAIKGANGFSRTFIQRVKKKGKPLFIVGVDAIKSQIFNKLAKTRAIRFSATLTADYFEQLTSERRVIKLTRGRPVMRFERKPAMDAEALDCLVYAHAARAALSLNFSERQDQLALQTR